MTQWASERDEKKKKWRANIKKSAFSCCRLIDIIIFSSSSWWQTITLSRVMLSLLQCQVSYLHNVFICTEKYNFKHALKLTKEAIKIWKLCNFLNLLCRMRNFHEGMVSGVLLTYKREAIGIMLTPVLSRWWK